MKSISKKIFSLFILSFFLFNNFLSVLDIEVFAKDVQGNVINLEMFNQNAALSEQRIDPRFNLTNLSDETIDLKNVKIRYYYFVGGETPQDFWCDYSSIGTGVVSGKFVTLPVPMVGADHYVEISFDENVGALGQGKSIDIKTRFSRSDGVYYDQSDDYSFNDASKNKFVEWTKATVYINDQLVWGEEPSQPLTIMQNAKVQMYNKHRNDSWDAIHTYFKLFNTGNVQLNLSDVVIRYYYTKDGNQSENFIVDSSSIDENKITSKFVTLPPAFSNENVTDFVDIGFTPDAGYIIAGDNLEIQSRVKKSDDSMYNQKNDYSFNPTDTDYIDWTKVSVYIKGKLVWGNGVIAEVPTKFETQATENTVTIDWEDIYAATSYEIEADGVVKNVGTNTIFTDTNLQPGTEHKYRVRAISDVNKGDWSTVVVKWTLPDITQNISAVSTSSSIIVSWAPIQGVTSYEIEVSGMPVDVGMNTSYIHDGLNPNTQRAYRVRGKNSSGVGKWSEVISKSTLPGSSFGINATATDKSISLVWDKASGATAYDLEVDGVIISDIADCKYTHDNLLPSTEHSYRVRPKNADGISNWTNLVKVFTLPETPTGISADVKADSITISWNAAGGAESYDIEIDGVVKDIGNTTTYVYEGLKNNSEHAFRVRAKFHDVTSMWSKTVSTATLPGVPENLNAVVTADKIEISWDIVDGASSYDIEIDGNIIYNLNINKYTLEKITPNTEYTFRVRAVSNAGASEWCEAVKRASLIGVPQNLNAVAANDSIYLEWQPVTGATGYDVLADGELLDVSTATYYSHKGLQPNTMHFYRVRAKNESGSGEWTAPLLVTTIQGVPGNLRANITSTMIIAVWDQVYGATSYDVKVDGTIINIVDGNIFLHEGLSPNSEHTYSVRSKKDSVVSPWSNEIKVRTSPGIPQNLRAEASTSDIKLSWDNVDGATSYDIEVDGTLINGYDAELYIHDGLESNTRHSYRVRSRSASGTSEWSELLQKNTNPVLAINAGKDNTFNFIFVIPAKWDAAARTITVKYNPDELEVVDLCAVTPTLENAPGKVEGTNITVASFISGEIVYKVDEISQTLVNSIKFMSKVNGYSKVVYTIE